MTSREERSANGKSALHKCFWHGMQGRLVCFCRPFVSGVEKHTDSLMEIAIKPIFPVRVSYPLDISHIVYSVPSLSKMPMAYPEFYKFSGMHGSCAGQFPSYICHQRVPVRQGNQTDRVQCCIPYKRLSSSVYEEPVRPMDRPHDYYTDLLLIPFLLLP